MYIYIIHLTKDKIANHIHNSYLKYYNVNAHCAQSNELTTENYKQLLTPHIHI